MKVIVLVAAVLTMSCGGTVDRRLHRQWTISACHFEIPLIYRQANGNYQLLVDFTIDAGELRAVRAESGKAQLEVDDQVKDCLRGWRLPDIPNGTKAEVLFQWIHAKGWTSQTLKLLDETFEVVTWGNPCPYCR